MSRCPYLVQDSVGYAKECGREPADFRAVIPTLDDKGWRGEIVHRLYDSLRLCDRHLAELARAVGEAWGHWREREFHAEQARRKAQERVYVIRRHSDGAIKIGFSASLDNRLSALRREHGPIEHLLTLRGGREAERNLHGLFAADRLTGEWFVESEALSEWIERVARRREGAAT